MSCEIISSVMSPAHIDELNQLSKTKKSHIGTKLQDTGYIWNYARYEIQKL